MKTTRHALLFALLTSSFVLAQDNAPVVVPTPTFGNEGAATPPATVAGEQPPADQPPAAPEAEANKPVEAAIPQTYRDDRYTGTLGKNPFLLKTKVIDNQPSTFAQDWELKSLRETKGTVKAGLQNRQTQQYRTIGPEPDAEGFKIVSAKIGRNRKDSTVEVAKGSETATFTFSDAPAGGGRAPQGGIVPGQPQQGQAGVPRAGQAAMPQNYRQPGAPVQSGAAGGVQRAPVTVGGMPVPGQNPNVQQGQRANMPPGVVPGAATAAPPNPINRRRVLIPAPAPASSPAP